MKANASLAEIDQRIVWLEAILQNPDANKRAPRNREQTYKTELSRLVRRRQLLLTPPLL
jgi:hypothetical protein